MSKLPRCGQSVGWGLSLALAFCVLLPAGVSRAAENYQTLTPQAKKLVASCTRRLTGPYEARCDSARGIILVMSKHNGSIDQALARLQAFNDALRSTPLNQPLPWTMTILIPDQGDYGKLVRDGGLEGVYYTDSRSATTYDPGRGVRHEFIHAIHHADAVYQLHAVWVWEGFASLFEHSRITPAGKLEPQLDGRLRIIQQAVRDGTCPSLNELMSRDCDQFNSLPQLHYGMARYVMLYLHEQGLLGKWYQAYKADYKQDTSGALALEKVTGKPLEQVQTAWRLWLLTRELRWVTFSNVRASLGVETRPVSNGVQVVRLMDNSPAELLDALRVGDVIQEVNGCKAAADLDSQLTGLCAGQSVPLVLDRRGQRMVLEQVLGPAQN